MIGASLFPSFLDVFQSAQAPAKSPSCFFENPRLLKASWSDGLISSALLKSVIADSYCSNLFLALPLET